MKKIGDFGDHGDVAANGYCIDPDFLLQCGPGYGFRTFLVIARNSSVTLPINQSTGMVLLKQRY